jgi:serine protease Do
MKFPRAFVIIAAFSVVLGCYASESTESSKIVPDAVTSSLRAAVVEVSVARSTPNRVATGAGFFVSRDGRVLTDWHVIRDAVDITVQTRGKTFPALVLAQDPEDDLAILRIVGDDFPALQLADTDRPLPGLRIAMIGVGEFPCQEGHTGVIRQLVGRSMLQISIPLRPGYSGSPLVDGQGRVVGIVNGQYIGATPAQDENYAVPVAPIRRLLAQSPPPPTERPIH